VGIREGYQGCPSPSSGTRAVPSPRWGYKGCGYKGGVQGLPLAILRDSGRTLAQVGGIRGVGTREGCKGCPSPSSGTRAVPRPGGGYKGCRYEGGVQGLPLAILRDSGRTLAQVGV
jgi:hypothetical protein